MSEAKGREEARRETIEAEGRKPGQTKDGRDPFAPKATAQRNFTDPDWKIMKASDGAFHQSYNAQAVVVCVDLSSQAPDCPQLEAALTQLDGNLAAIEAELPADATLSADVGYFSVGYVTITADHGLDPYIATGRQVHSGPPPILPAGQSPKTPPRPADDAKTQNQEGPAV